MTTIEEFKILVEVIGNVGIDVAGSVLCHRCKHLDEQVWNQPPPYIPLSVIPKIEDEVI